MDPSLDPAFTGHALAQVGLGGQVVVLALMLGCAGWTAARPGPLPLTALAACAALWLRADSRLEGAVLFTVTPAHGLTVADLLVPALGCVVLLAVRRTRSTRSTGGARRVRWWRTGWWSTWTASSSATAGPASRSRWRTSSPTTSAGTWPP